MSLKPKDTILNTPIEKINFFLRTDENGNSILSEDGKQCGDLIAKAEKAQQLLKPSIQTFTVNQVAQKLNVSPQTVRNWEHEGKFIPFEVTAGGKHRRYTENQINEMKKKLMNTQSFLLPKIKKKKLVEVALNLVNCFQDEDELNIMIEFDELSGVFKIVAESEDNLSLTSSKIFKRED